MNVDEQRIREFAYQIWQSEGCPVGQEERHWEMACKLAEAEAAAPTAKPAPRARRTKPKEAPAASEASAAETAAAPKKPRAPRKTTASKAASK